MFNQFMEVCLIEFVQMNNQKLDVISKVIEREIVRENIKDKKKI